MSTGSGDVYERLRDIVFKAFSARLLPTNACAEIIIPQGTFRRSAQILGSEPGLIIIDEFAAIDCGKWVRGPKMPSILEPVAPQSRRELEVRAREGDRKAQLELRLHDRNAATVANRAFATKQIDDARKAREDRERQAKIKANPNWGMF